MDKKISLLGSTGSIGTQTLEVARMHGFSVCALAAHSNIQLLEEQIREFRPALAAVFDENAARDLKERVRDLPVRVAAGMDGLCQAASIQEADIVCNAVVGMVGLLPTMAAVSAKKDVALANKETLVAGGALVMKAARENGVRILPVDSEHSAIFQCLQGCPRPSTVARLILTASGGPFFGKTREELEQVTPEQALRHPNWSMGAKVTIDSATMMNKGLEILEASWLFDMPVSQIDVVVHRESIVHSMIEYQDYSVLAQLGVPDMRIPIQYALTWPERLPSPVNRLSLTELGTLSFYPPDEQAFPCLGLAKQAAQQGGLTPAAMNGANEEAVKLFLSGRIPFLQIPQLVEAAMKRQAAGQPETPQQVLTADQNARNFVLESVQ
ncbi:1-deoxy-D-xylulose 5-phosphate reductoisomerase [Clostridium sp. MSTE9]|uniref:1-deoxy-D-xylulose-5-phosphate reductoisomerase n=1 Tax=Clostridium sp. (strain MSTE9) TaxID=1105031 RepID=UPI00026F2667|nr:1-deoxy-D-xylulose-5-phosphate reductoisomerase [Clostridium sp. MSTE9]EJF42491.1 1-deoxy-D-xylulose 5-phosphate reductoisomerase [Clostridium sp. MSTE9]